MFHIEFNTKEFERALRQYAAASRKDWSEIVNQKALDVALRAAAETKKANVPEIRALPETSWWWKFIAKQFKGSRFTRRQAKEASRKIIAARVRAINFTRAGWFEGARILAARLGKGLRISGSAKKSFGTAIPSNAFQDNPTAIIINRVEAITKVDQGALQRASSYVAKDMMQYVARKMQQTARRFSAK